MPNSSTGMDQFLQIIVGVINWIVTFYNSTAFSILKFILGIYVVVLLIDIVLLLMQRGLTGNVRETLFGMAVHGDIVRKKKKNKFKLQWQKIKSRMDSDLLSEYKVAIIEADNLAFDMLKKSGYDGKNMAELLQRIFPGQVENLEELKRAHEIRNSVVLDQNFSLDKEKAEKTVEVYEDFFNSLELLN